MTDSTITRAIEERFTQDDHVPEYLIDVHVKQGLVTFTGEVNHILARERVTALAETIRGVRGVINHLVVLPSPPVSDENLKGSIADALLEDPVTELYDLSIDIQDGMVTLNGSVQSWVEKQLAVHVVKGINGVREVQDIVQIAPNDTRSDQAMAAEITRSLATDVWIHGETIHVKVEDGTAILTGTVPTAAQKSRATNLSWVYGISEVDNDDLDIDAAQANPMQRPGFPSFSNHQIKLAVQNSLSHDPRVDSGDISVHLRDGLVTLRGIVENLRAKQAAGEDALNTTGVYMVRNRLQVRTPHQLSDADLVRTIQATFSHDPFINGEDIHISVRNGVVYLRGKVNTRFQKFRASTVTSRLKGIVEVINQIEYPIKWLWKSDFEIRENIRDRLWWSALLASQGIEVRVEDGVAILRGRASSLQHKQNAEDAAYEAGARSVVNHIRLQALN